MADLHGAGRVHHRVLREGGGVQEVEDGVAAVHGGEPGGAVAGHHRLHGVHAEPLAHVGLLALAQLALPALPVEYRHHVVSFFQVLHAFTYAFYYSVCNVFISSQISHFNYVYGLNLLRSK